MTDLKIVGAMFYLLLASICLIGLMNFDHTWYNILVGIVGVMCNSYMAVRFIKSIFNSNDN
jgi:hypothetical protein